MSQAIQLHRQIVVLGPFSAESIHPLLKYLPEHVRARHYANNMPGTGESNKSNVANDADSNISVDKAKIASALNAAREMSRLVVHSVDNQTKN